MAPQQPFQLVEMAPTATLGATEKLLPRQTIYLLAPML